MISNQLPIKMILQAWIKQPPVQHLRAIQQLEFNNFKGCFAGYLVFVNSLFGFIQRTRRF